MDVKMASSKNQENTGQLFKAYSAETPEEVSGCYDNWADDYESHMRNVGYLHPAMVASLLTRHLPPGTDPILDAGAGTGILGVILTSLGYPNVVGFDGSESMLATAAIKNTYAELHQMYLGKHLKFPDDSFAAAVSAGVFTQGHAPLCGLVELARVVRAGGLIVFSVARTYLDGPFQEQRESMEREGIWDIVGASERYDSTPLGEENLTAQVYAFKVN